MIQEKKNTRYSIHTHYCGPLWRELLQVLSLCTNTVDTHHRWLRLVGLWRLCCRLLISKLYSELLRSAEKTWNLSRELTKHSQLATLIRSVVTTRHSIVIPLTLSESISITYAHDNYQLRPSGNIFHYLLVTYFTAFWYSQKISKLKNGLVWSILPKCSSKYN